MALVKFGVAGFRGASTLEGTIDNALDQLMAGQAQMQQNQPPTEMQHQAGLQSQVSQTKIQVAQIQADSAQKIAQLEAQVKAQELQLKQAALELKAKDMAQQEVERTANMHIDAIEKSHSHAMDITDASHQQNMDLLNLGNNQG